MATETGPLDERAAEEAIRQALSEFPQFADYVPRLVCAPLADGVAYLVRYRQHPGKDAPQLWAFQNAVVRGYRRQADPASARREESS